MPISERALHPYIKGLVEEYGELTVTDLDNYLRVILDLDETDLTTLAGRGDDKFSQIIRNLVSHAPEAISSHNGYIVDKRGKPAKFYAISATKFNLTDVENRIVTLDEIKERRERKRLFNARKVDFNSLNRERTELGNLGEQFALEWERNRLRDLRVPFEVLDEVIHFSQKYGDGAGYDILSRVDASYERMYIEVKSTKKGLFEPFFLSANEKAFMDLYENVVIYRVYNFDKELNIGEIEIIDKTDLYSKYKFDPVTYKVTLNS